MIGDAMIGGFALIATPAEYAVTGVQHSSSVTTASCIKKISAGLGGPRQQIPATTPTRRGYARTTRGRSERFGADTHVHPGSLGTPLVCRGSSGGPWPRHLLLSGCEHIRGPLRRETTAMTRLIGKPATQRRTELSASGHFFTGQQLAAQTTASAPPMRCQRRRRMGPRPSSTDPGNNRRSSSGKTGYGGPL